MSTHLNTHSYYSLLRGTASPEALCQAAKSAGCEALALTDTNGLYGLVLFLEAAKEAGIRPIIGAEIRLSNQNDRVPALCTRINSGAPFKDELAKANAATSLKSVALAT